MFFNWKMGTVNKPVLAVVVTLLLPGAALAQTSPIEAFNKAQYNLNTGDVVAAMALFREAAEQNYAPAQARLAWILDGANRDEEAVKWYSKAAAQSNSEGQFGLAEMYIKGEGVETDLPLALDLITQAAEQDYKPAIRKLADAYEHGRHNLGKDYELAIKWLERGLNNGDSWAADRLAKAYRQGELGLAVDETKAVELETKAQSMRSFN